MLEFSVSCNRYPELLARYCNGDRHSEDFFRLPHNCPPDKSLCEVWLAVKELSQHQLEQDLMGLCSFVNIYEN